MEFPRVVVEQLGTIVEKSDVLGQLRPTRRTGLWQVRRRRDDFYPAGVSCGLCRCVSHGAAPLLVVGQ